MQECLIARLLMKSNDLEMVCLVGLNEHEEMEAHWCPNKVILFSCWIGKDFIMDLSGLIFKKSKIGLHKCSYNVHSLAFFFNFHEIMSCNLTLCMFLLT